MCVLIFLVLDEMLPRSQNKQLSNSRYC